MKSAIKYGPLFGLSLALAAPAFGQSQQFPTYQVGPQANGTYVMSTAQIVNPAGTVTILGTPIRAKAIAINPANPTTGAVLQMGAPAAVQVFNLATGALIQSYSPSGVSNGSFTGLTYSPDGSTLIISQDDSYVAFAHVDPNAGTLTDWARVNVIGTNAYIKCKNITVGLPSDPINALCGHFYNSQTNSEPGGLTVSADGTTAYAVLNQNDTLQAIDLTQNPPKLKGSQIRVGNVPNSVVVYNGFAYVSNEGGRPAKPKDFTNISSGTPIVASTESGTAVTGTVSVVNLSTGAEVMEIKVGLHPSGMTAVGNLLYVCDAGSDTVSVINMTTNKVVQKLDLTIPLSATLGRPIFGAEPTSIAVVGSTAYVTLYTLNAIAVVDLTKKHGTVLGYIPTASTPDSIVYDATHNQLVVANDKGLGTWGEQVEIYGVTGYNTHEDTATINLIPIPTSQQLAAYTTQVYQNNHWDLTVNIDAAFGGSPNTPPVAIPAHIGDPSLIQHVFLIVRENRTYDQILGDVAGGNGDPNLVIFGQNVTPNAHALVQRWPLLDNYYDPSRQSADGHNWLVQAMSPYGNDIQSPDWVRSYPANGEDAMSYQPAGFVWDAAEQAGLKVKLYGEYTEYAGDSFKQPNGSTSEPSWSQWFADSQAYEAGQESQLYYQTTYNTISEIPSVQNYHLANFPVFDLGLPDQWRVDWWWEDFQNDLANNSVPALTTLWIMCDHTGGPPTAAAEQADNDLAIGRIVDIISHSSVWANSAIFITEDDAQAGVDHVDGHRSPGYVVSPYAVEYQGENPTNFTQVNMTRTIEQILGLPVMNQFDLVASPMYNLFTNTPDTTPWTHVANNIPLNQGVTDTFHGTGLAKAWHDAKTKVFSGVTLRKADSVDSNFVNHMTWYEATGYKRPYPGETRMRAPSEFQAFSPYRDADD
jgi:YVTN family beta-propeller protein